MQRTHTRREFLTAAGGANVAGAACAGIAPARQIDAEDLRLRGSLADTIGIDRHSHVTPADARPQQGPSAKKSQPTLDWPTRSTLGAHGAALRPPDFNASDPYAKFLRGLTAIDRSVVKGSPDPRLERERPSNRHDRGSAGHRQSIEGVHFLEGHLDRVEGVISAGLRDLQLLHDKGDKIAPLGDINTEPASLGGLTARRIRRQGVQPARHHRRPRRRQPRATAALKVSTQPTTVCTPASTRGRAATPARRKDGPAADQQEPCPRRHRGRRRDRRGPPVRLAWKSTSGASRRWWTPSASTTSIGSDTDIQSPRTGDLTKPFGPVFPADSSKRQSLRCCARASRPARSARSAAGTSAGFDKEQPATRAP